MRGQASIAEDGGLRGRIWAALDDRQVGMEFAEIEPVGRRYRRPVAGFAIAATVAVAAIFGLQQFGTDSGLGIDSSAPAVAEDAVDESYTVPDIDYFQRHSEFSSEVGNNNFDFRRVSAEVDEDVELDENLEEIDPPQDMTPAESTE